MKNIHFTSGRKNSTIQIQLNLNGTFLRDGDLHSTRTFAQQL